MIYLCIDPVRLRKTRRIMDALRQGAPAGGARICVGRPPRGRPFVIWGHRWLAEEVVPQALKDGTEFWMVDNGFHLPAAGGEAGYHAITRRGVAPAWLPNADRDRLKVYMSPWRTGRDGYVLLALPGKGFGRSLGINTAAWVETIEQRIRQHTDRPILVREKGCPRPLAEDLAGAFVLVTHSSKVAVDAVRAGVPVVVEPTNAAAPVGSTRLEDIENPPRPERSQWWASLMAQQFNLAEMAAGRPWALIGANNEGRT